MFLLHVTESDFTNLWLLVIITNLTTLLPLPFLGWLPKEKAESFTVHSVGSEESYDLSPAGADPAKPLVGAQTDIS
jgi:hypothetical protein